MGRRSIRARAALLLGAVLGSFLLSFAQPLTAQPAEPEARTKLVVGTKVVKPFAFKGPDGKWTGISIELFQEMNRGFGYQVEWAESPSTNALVDEVSAGKVDLGIAAITMTPERAERVDFSNSMFKSGLGIAVRPEPQGALGALGDLVTPRVLGGVGMFVGVLLGVGLLLWLFERKANPQFEPDARAGIWSGFWWSAVTMTTVGYGDKAPKTVPGRILGIVWMFASIILISSFTAAVASQLTADRIQSTVNGEEDLRRAKVGAKAGESPETVLRSMGVVPVAFPSIAEGLDALARGEIDAFVHDAPVLQYEIVHGENRLAERLSVLPKVMRVEEYGIAVARPADPARRNELRDRVNRALLEAKTNGRLDEITRKYLGER